MPSAFRVVAAPIAVALAAACAANQPAVISTEYSQQPSTPAEEAFVRQLGGRPIKFGGWIRTLRAGDGPSPTPDSVVKVHYRGTLLDGTEFDSSYRRGQPAEFSLRGVVRCWTFGVAMMKVGEKASLLCPASTAYGEAGAPPAIPPNAELVFEIELLDIVR